MSPACKILFLLGIQWTNSSFTEVHKLAGYGLLPRSANPKKAGSAPSLRSRSSASLSNSNVDTPGLTSFVTCHKTAESIFPPSASVSISFSV